MGHGLRDTLYWVDGLDRYIHIHINVDIGICKKINIYQWLNNKDYEVRIDEYIDKLVL